MPQPRDDLDKGESEQGRRTREQPYTTESEAYSADNVKPPTAPEQRAAAKASRPGQPAPKDLRR